MLVIGIVAGTIASLAVTRRSQIKRFARWFFNGTPKAFDESGGVEAANPVSVTSHRSNHRRKAESEVT